MSEMIFVVTGTTGEYSDQVIWVARAFRTALDADNWISDMHVFLQGHGMLDGKPDDFPWTTQELEEDERWTEARKRDPRFDIDYTGTQYAKTKVELR